MGAAAAPILIGSAIGAATNKNPLKGALMGGILGGAGGAFMGGGLGASSAIAAAPASAGTGLMPGAVGAFGQAVPAIIPTTTGAMTTAMGAGGNVAALGAQEFAPSFMDSAKIGLGNIGQYAQQNPVLSQMAMQGAQSLLSNQQQQPAPAGLMRGNPSQVQMPQYQVGVPKVSLI